VADGQILAADGPAGLSYWTLAQPGMLDRPAEVPVPSRPPGAWSVAGRSAPRLDIPDKVTGRPRFLHDLVLPGMAYGRVVRPPARAADLTRLADTDLGRDVVLVRDGSFPGVVTETDRAALRAAGQVARAAQWRTTPSLPDAKVSHFFPPARFLFGQRYCYRPKTRLSRSLPDCGTTGSRSTGSRPGWPPGSGSGGRA
jgi:nicotinate dehydrogenase subunit B